MSNKSPVYPIPESQHYSDYGFDPQIDYFQILEEAKKHKRETSSRPSIDTLQFKLQKPIPRDEHPKRNRVRWWKNAILFFTRRRWLSGSRRDDLDLDLDGDVHRARARAFRSAGSISGPVYVTESRSGSITPYRNRTASGPLNGTVETPYLSLRELTMEQQQGISASPTPIYLVT